MILEIHRKFSRSLVRETVFCGGDCYRQQSCKFTTSSLGVIMYTNILHVDGEFKLRTWRLKGSWEWQGLNTGVPW